MPASLSEDTVQAKQPFRVGLPVRQHRRAALQLLRGHLPAAPTQRRATLSPRLSPSELGAAAQTALAMVEDKLGEQSPRGLQTAPVIPRFLDAGGD